MKLILISVVVVVIVVIVIALVIAKRKPKEERGSSPQEGASQTPPPIPEYMHRSLEPDGWEETGVLGTENEETSILGIDEEETTILGQEEETAVLGSQSQRRATLTRLKNEETAVLDKPVFSLGRERSQVDLCISDNSKVSREHAIIRYGAGDYFLCDNHSANGTFVNDQKIHPDQEVRLHSGDRIRLADEDFLFRLG